MQEVIEKENIKIEEMIYEIRGVQVMLDSDLATLFNVETGNLNKAMKRNVERFPLQFCFQLTKDEYSFLLFQIGIAKKKGGRTTLPYVYSEQGVAMISSLLHSEIAIKMSIAIINTFVLMRHYITKNSDVYQSLNIMNNKLDNYINKLVDHDEKINYLFSKFDRKEQLIEKNTEYDIYSDIIKILSNDKEEIIIVDSYADINLLDLIRNINCKVILITKDSPRLSNIEIEKYNKQYSNLTVIRNNSFHDRYFVLDGKEIYLLGSSINSLGEKISMLVKLEDRKSISALIGIITEIIN